MTITQLQQLGTSGDELIYLLKEIGDAVSNPKDFDDHAHQIEYVQDTIQMIQRQLTNLKSKQL